MRHIDQPGDLSNRVRSSGMGTDAGFLLWAKIGMEAGATFAHRHPLICHCVDVGVVARMLWNRVIQAGVRTRLARACGLGDNVGVIGRWLSFWAASHDLGKASPGFQFKRPDAIPPLESAGFLFDARQDRPHGFVSTHVLAQLLCQSDHLWPAIDPDLARRVGIAVGGHHGLFPSAQQWNQEITPDVLGTGPQWHEARLDILQRLRDVFGIDNNLPTPQNLTEADKHWPMMILAGLVSVADWIGSNKCFFPHEPQARDLAAYVELADDRAGNALERLGWLKWSPTSSQAKAFGDLFPFSPRPLQEAVAAAADAAAGPTLMIVEAPMGEGKTEAALYVADQCTHRLGGQGLYVAMPTMATGNQMFTRVAEFLAHRYPTQVVNFQLLHSGAMLSDDFSELQRVAEVNRQSFQPSGIDEKGEAHGAVVAEAWFAQNKKQAILAPFGVGTIDQALLSVLQVKHGFVRLFGLAGKTIILDEVHAYDTYMSTLLGRLLEWLSALGCTVVLLSATLPSEKRRTLLKAWNGMEPKPDTTAYPRLTVAAHGSPATVTHFEADPARMRTIQVEWRDESRLAEELESQLGSGGCAAVIRNTVGQAQKTFIELRDRLSHQGFDVRLFHARFPFEDRQRIEREVLNTFGKGNDGQATNPLRPLKAVLVATQVIEQSLDLDFDLMVSDLAPADLVLQRAGRLHRHDRPGRPFQMPTLWLIKPLGFDGVPDFGRAHEGIYDRYVLLRSFLALRERPTVSLPGEIDDLVHEVYDGDGLIDGMSDAWESELNDSRSEMEAEQSDHRKLAKEFCLAKPTDSVRFVLNRSDLDDDNPELPSEQQASTRLPDGITVQVVFLSRGSKWSLRKTPPTISEARSLLRRAMNVQGKLWRGSLIGSLLSQPVPPGWRECGMLRYARLIELDELGRSVVGDFNVRIDPQLGLLSGKGDV